MSRPASRPSPCPSLEADPPSSPQGRVRSSPKPLRAMFETASTSPRLVRPDYLLHLLEGMAVAGLTYFPTAAGICLLKRLNYLGEGPADAAAAEFRVGGTATRVEFGADTGCA